MYKKLIRITSILVLFKPDFNRLKLRLIGTNYYIGMCTLKISIEIIKK